LRLCESVQSLSRGLPNPCDQHPLLIDTTERLGCNPNVPKPSLDRKAKRLGLGRALYALFGLSVKTPHRKAGRCPLQIRIPNLSALSILPSNTTPAKSAWPFWNRCAGRMVRFVRAAIPPRLTESKVGCCTNAANVLTNSPQL